MDEKELLEIIEEAARDGRAELDLLGKHIESLPAEIGHLNNLTKLSMSLNRLTSIPVEIGQLTSLTELDLSFNKLTAIPSELLQLTKLTKLSLYANQLTSIPKEIGQLTNLTELVLSANQLTSVPKEIGQLTNLTELSLYRNRLTSVPKELGQLTNLTEFSLGRNQLTSVPKELGQLTNLTKLDLCLNQIKSIPKELGQLTNLTELDLLGNQLTSVPKELGQLTNLTKLSLSGKEGLTSPPPEVVEQGTKAVLAYLRELEGGEGLKWEAKLLIVGEAGVGKTELVKALRGEEFGGESATEGILIRPLNVQHPKQPRVKMKLNLWDFGGQEIQHATHQFFYSERALFLLAFDARQNYKQAKLNDWLELIQARASIEEDKDEKKEWRVPVLMVATHCDLWRPDIPYEELKRQFPRIQFLGLLKVSNKPPRNGIENLEQALAEAASNLPLMGMRWPDDWQEVENKLTVKVENKESRIELGELRKLMDEVKVSEGSQELLIKVLDGMGKIRVFLDDEQLRDIVVLNPQWLTNRIARVLKNQDKDKKPICRYAILRRKQWSIFWPDESEETHRIFVRMMRNFDLVYELEDSPDAWLVVQLLPYQSGEEDSRRMVELWSSFEGGPEIKMKLRLEQSIPPGIPTWFIAREHRFSLDLHCRLGVLLADNPKNPKHLGLVQAYPEQRYIELSVRGPMPHNFFVVLRDGLEYTLARFPGLKIKRTFPCPGHDDEKCKHEFDLRQLEKAVLREKPILEIQCPEVLENVSVSQLLFGVHWSTQDAVMAKIASMEKSVSNKVEGARDAILAQVGELQALSQRNFTYAYNRDQRLDESHCPNVFAVLPKEGQSWLKDLLSQKMVMQLYCQAPGQWHPAVEGAKGGRYEIKKPGEFLGSMGPYILRLAKVIKFVVPLVGAAAGVVTAGPVGGVIGAKLAAQIKVTEELAGKLADRDYIEGELLERTGAGGKAERIEGMELRALRKVLDEVDRKQEWGGLKKVLTPEGHYLWLCKEHAEEYRK